MSDGRAVRLHPLAAGRGTQPVSRRQPLLTRYLAELAEHGHEPDAAQLQAVRRLDDLRRRLLAREADTAWFSIGLLSLLGRRRSTDPERGVYLWGGVGRGKTRLLDLFFDELPLVAKRRVHFHQFMHDVHAELATLKEVESPLERVAGRIAAEVRVLCFDELFVSDITDAMLLGGLFDALFRRGVTLVVTSNTPPGQLYRDGLQRQRFLPAIALLEKHMEVLEVDAGNDYRLRQLERAPIYLGPGVEDRERLLTQKFIELAGSAGTADTTIRVLGRAVPVRRIALGVAWFDFDALCRTARSAEDYLELARLYHTLFVSGVPVLGAGDDDAARRWIALVDECYDRGVKLVIEADAAPDALYNGERLAFEFARTTSRLVEMQSHDYLARPHRA